MVGQYWRRLLYYGIAFDAAYEWHQLEVNACIVKLKIKMRNVMLTLMNEVTIVLYVVSADIGSLDTVLLIMSWLMLVARPDIMCY